MQSLNSEKQYQYCTFCQLNHTQGYKHIYSKRHTNVISDIISKLNTKISHAKAYMSSPKIESHGFEASKGIWCYFCACEVPQHYTTDMFTVVMGAFLRHLSSKEHAVNSQRFIRDNRINNFTDFIVDEPSLTRYYENVQGVLETEKKKRQLKLKKAHEHILASETERASVHLSGLLTARQPTAPPEHNWSEPSPGTLSTAVVSSRRTISAHSVGLTCVKVPRTGGGVGNVHSGALPPWLQGSHGEWNSNRSNSRDVEIGPTKSDLDKYVAEEEKRKLPDTRVGATFRRGETDPGWLPMFGRVWSNHRRQDDKKQFEGRQQSKRVRYNPASHSVTSGVTSATRLTPYQRKTRPESHQKGRPARCEYSTTNAVEVYTDVGTRAAKLTERRLYRSDSEFGQTCVNTDVDDISSNQRNLSRLNSKNAESMFDSVSSPLAGNSGVRHSNKMRGYRKNSVYKQRGDNINSSIEKLEKEKLEKEKLEKDGQNNFAVIPINIELDTNFMK